MAMISLSVIFGCNRTDSPSSRDSAKTDNWFEKGEWLQGWKVKPDRSINRKAFAQAYNKNPERWNKAFVFLRENDLKVIEPKRYDLDGDNLYVMVSEYKTKNPEDAKFEAHKKYIDLQYVASGVELIGIAHIASMDSVIQDYDDTKDILFFTVKDSKTVPALNSGFFIFFPEDAHSPGMKHESNSSVRKIVVKLKID